MASRVKTILVSVVLHITIAGDGIKATNNNDLTVGYVEVSGGDVTNNASKDGIQAESFVNVYGGIINITAKSGYTNGKQHSDAGGFPGSSSSTTITTDSTGKGLKAGKGVIVYGGTIIAQFGDDGVHTDTTLYVASGDGLDSNGNAVMTGGTALVSGPTNGGNGALDYNGTFNISGGILVAVGATGMVHSTLQRYIRM